MKPPSYAVQAIFYRLVPDCENVKTSNAFIHRGRCPLCHDHKQRMYIKEYGDRYHVYCHNCGYSNGFYQFLKDEFPEALESLKQYVLDSIRTGDFIKKKVTKEPEIDRTEEFDMKLRCYLQDNAFPLKRKQAHAPKEQCRLKAIEYLTGRKIREDDWSEFFFVFDGQLRGYIGIPMWDARKMNILHVQGRLLFKSRAQEKQEKYLFLKDTAAGIESISKPIFGLWRVDPAKTVYMSEGTLSALAFGKQGLATCGARISRFYISSVHKQFKDVVWSFDNYWVDKTGKEMTDKLLLMGEKCFIPPKGVTCKDTNDLLFYLDADEIPSDYVLNNTYEGKMGYAKLKLA